jgi:hypothetical protein
MAEVEKLTEVEEMSEVEQATWDVNSWDAQACG